MPALLSLFLLGAWLLVSGFLWPHSEEQLLLAVVGGSIAMLLSLLGLFRREVTGRLRLTAWWLMSGALFLPAVSQLSVANHIIVGLGVLAFSSFARPSSQGVSL
jgi:hypothetical protein